MPRIPETVSNALVDAAFAGLYALDITNRGICSILSQQGIPSLISEPTSLGFQFSAGLLSMMHTIQLFSSEQTAENQRNIRGIYDRLLNYKNQLQQFIENHPQLKSAFANIIDLTSDTISLILTYEAFNNERNQNQEMSYGRMAFLSGYAIKNSAIIAYKLYSIVKKDIPNLFENLQNFATRNTQEHENQPLSAREYPTSSNRSAFLDAKHSSDSNQPISKVEEATWQELRNKIHEEWKKPMSQPDGMVNEEEWKELQKNIHDSLQELKTTTSIPETHPGLTWAETSKQIEQAWEERKQYVATQHTTTSTPELDTKLQKLEQDSFKLIEEATANTSLLHQNPVYSKRRIVEPKTHKNDTPVTFSKYRIRDPKQPDKEKPSPQHRRKK